MSALLQDTLDQLNRIRRHSYAYVLSARVARALFLALSVLGLWSALSPDDKLGQVVLTLLTFVVGMAFNSKKHTARIAPDEVLFSLEIKHGRAATAPFSLRYSDPDPSVTEEWAPLLGEEVAAYRAFEKKRMMRILSTLPIPLLCFALTTSSSSGAIRTAFSSVSQVVAQLAKGVTLTVLEGLPGDKEKAEPIRLSLSRPAEIELLMENMIEIKVVGDPGEVPTVSLKKRIPGKSADHSQDAPFQSFQMAPIREGLDDSGTYSIAFAVTDDVAIYVSTLSKTSPAALISVRQLPVPKVRLEVEGELRQPWPDDKPLPLRIDVTADNPLEQVRLTIKSGQRVYQEVVNNILAADIKEVSSPYQLTLESYVESDTAEVEIVAEAVDRSLPLPLVGQSPPLLLKTVSAYGRYRETLATLRESKGILDEIVGTGKPEDLDRLVELTTKAISQSDDSPFFDGLDRVHFGRFQMLSKELKANFQMEATLDFQKNLNDFLFEHEILDDKERDRDFFVAARALSRLLERPRDKRAVSVTQVTGRVKAFLEERHKRWQLRVERLSQAPRQWEKVKAKPYHRAMDKVAAADREEKPEATEPAMIELSNTVSSYREWIEALEAEEEKWRKEEQEKRQQGLANAQNTLRELQRRQGQIASKLDKAAERKPEDFLDVWPPTRLDQNANIQQTSELEAQLRALSPTAGERVKAAIAAMKATVESGNGQDFVQAESGADLAGRLLRQAESAAQRSQQQGQKRGRRRRVTGDSYYGSQVAGGDVEIRREYEVNRRYREDILDDVRRGTSDRDDDELLENYLRRVIR